MVSLGSDINRNWDFENGDLKIVEDGDNIMQSIYNRLNTYLGSMSQYYENYGSKLQDFYGWRKDTETLEFINLELKTALEQDVRFESIEVDSHFEGNTLKSDITIQLEEGEVEFNLILNEENKIEIIEDEEVLEDGGT